MKTAKFLRRNKHGECYWYVAIVKNPYNDQFARLMHRTIKFIHRLIEQVISWNTGVVDGFKKLLTWLVYITVKTMKGN